MVPSFIVAAELARGMMEWLESKALNFARMPRVGDTVKFIIFSESHFDVNAIKAEAQAKFPGVIYQLTTIGAL